MPNTFRDLLADDFRSIAANPDELGVSVTLRSGESTTADVRAFKTLPQALEESEDGRFIDTESADFLIAATDFLIDGSAVLPADGMEIDWNGSTFEVRPLAGEPSWRWSDSLETRYRIHTKLKSRS
jgi:hypothetical protein